MDQFIPAALSSLVTVGGIFLAYLASRKFKGLGGESAQIKLNATITQMAEAQTKEIASLRRQLDDAQADILEGDKERKSMAAEFRGCKERLIKLERLVADNALADDHARRTNAP